MKIKILFLILVSLLSSCNDNSGLVKESTSKVSSGISSSITKKSMSGEDDFSDLEKKKDESCDTAEDLEAKIEEKIKTQEAFKLQGGDPGCTTD